MRVKILSNINSGQFVADDVAEFSDDEARQLIEAGAAIELVEEIQQSIEQPVAEVVIEPQPESIVEIQSETTAQEVADKAPLEDQPVIGQPLESLPQSEELSAPASVELNPSPIAPEIPLADQIAQDIQIQ